MFLDEFNDIASKLVPSDASETDKQDDAVTGETDATDGKDTTVDGDDVEKAKEEQEENIKAANEVIHKIAVSFLRVSSGFCLVHFCIEIKFI